MRSGVIAQKLGMTRVFTDGGEHVPVTVLKLDGCQVVAHRTKERNGYTAVQLGIGHAKVKNVSKAERARFAIAKVEPKLKLAEFRVEEEGLAAGRRGNHRRSFRRRPIRRCHRHEIGKGFAGGMKRWNFGGLRATHGVSISHRSHGFDRRPSGSRQDLQEQENGRPSRRRAGDDAQSARRPDRCRTRPDPRRRRGSGHRRRLDLCPRRGEEGAAERGADAGQISLADAAAEAGAAQTAEG